MHAPESHRPLDDTELDGLLAAAVDVEPSAELLPRIRLRVAAQPMSSLPWLPWRQAGVLVAALGALLVAAAWPAADRPATLSPLPAGTHTTWSTVRPPVEPFTTDSMAVNARLDRASRIEAAGPQEVGATAVSTVRVSRRQMDALRALAASLSDAPVEDLPSAESASAAPQVAALDVVDIRPVSIDPLPRLPLLGGERR